MVGSCHTLVLQRYRERSIRQYFHRVAGFQVALAHAGFARELPARGDIVDERIVERLSDLVADRSYVFKSAAENARGNPAGELREPTALRHCAIREISVETQHAAAAALSGIVGIETNTGKCWAAAED